MNTRPLIYEYSAADIAKTLNPAMESRRRPIVVYVADLEDGFRESTIQKSVVKCFPMQIEFHRHTIVIGALKINFYKIKFLRSPDVGSFTIDSLAALITEKSQSKRRRSYDPPAAREAEAA